MGKTERDTAQEKLETVYVIELSEGPGDIRKHLRVGFCIFKLLGGAFIDTR